MGCITSQTYYDENNNKVFKGNFNNIKQDDLKKIEKEDLSYYTFAKFDNFYDGDTADIIYTFQNIIKRSRFRFYGYDAPEIKPKIDIKNRDKIIEKAKKSKDKLIELFNNKICLVKLMGRDKYGRILGEVYLFDFPKYFNKNINYYIENLEKAIVVSQYMIKNNFGYPYFGGKKNDLNIRK